MLDVNSHLIQKKYLSHINQIIEEGSQPTSPAPNMKKKNKLGSKVKGESISESDEKQLKRGDTNVSVSLMSESESSPAKRSEKVLSPIALMKKSK